MRHSIAFYDGIVSEKLCEQIKKEAKESDLKWTNFQDKYGKDTGTRQVPAEELPCYKEITDLVEKCVVHYCKVMNLPRNMYELDCSVLFSLMPAGYNEEHCDDTITIDVEGDNLSKDFTVLLYLSDLGEKGGELVFSRQSSIIRANLGRVVIFPTGIQYPHLTNPILLERWVLNLKYLRKGKLRMK